MFFYIKSDNFLYLLYKCVILETEINYEQFVPKQMKNELTDIPTTILNEDYNYDYEPNDEDGYPGNGNEFDEDESIGS